MPGRPRKGEVLRELIEEIVAARPVISASAVLDRLRVLQYQGIIMDIEDDQIWFTDASDASRSSPISGLTDPLLTNQ
jgi:hypothetical protein